MAETESGSTIIGRGIRILLAGITLVLAVWSFARVLSRPFRRAELRAGQVQLSVLHWGEKNEYAIVADLVADFESLPENQDIRILRMNLGQAAMVRTKLQTMFAAGDPPDVFYLGLEDVSDLATKGLLTDIEQLIAQDKARGVPTVDLGAMYPAIERCFRIDMATGRVGEGTLVGLAKDFTTVGFYYNRDLFRRAGVPEPSPEGWTWDEFIADAAGIIASVIIGYALFG